MSRSVCGREALTPGYAPCSRPPHKDGPCAHELTEDAEFERLRKSVYDGDTDVLDVWNLYARARADLDTADRALKAVMGAMNAPELHDFTRAVSLEAAHQRVRWGSDHDGGKTPPDWFWLVGYLAGKALTSHLKGDTDKALHHTITAAAALANWHATIDGAHTGMRPGKPSWRRIEFETPGEPPVSSDRGKE
jgi:hypothetical protein